MISTFFHSKKNLLFLFRSNHIKYIDVWPINVFDPKNGDPFDTVSLFMMQLATIINMLPKWKRLTLRIFLCDVSSESTVDSFDINVPQMEVFSKLQLESQLNKLRINAEIHEISDWSRNPEFTRLSPVLKQFTDTSDINVEALSDENINRSKMYMQRVNQIIQMKSSATAASFIYLPPPPKLYSPNWNRKSQLYLDLLTELTVDLPPTILVHGISTVISTTLWFY